MYRSADLKIAFFNRKLDYITANQRTTPVIYSSNLTLPLLLSRLVSPPASRARLSMGLLIVALCLPHLSDRWLC